MEYETKQPGTLQAACDALTAQGLTYTAEFIPWSKSRSAKSPPVKPGDYSLNWKITLSKGGNSLSTDYTAGIAHIPGYKQSWGRRMSQDQFDGIKNACETGRAGWNARMLIPGLGAKPIPAPLLRDALYSLSMDSDVLNSADFESWAADFGYETDSRKAETIYRACLDIALKLRAMIGDAGLSTLRDAAQDY